MRALVYDAFGAHPQVRDVVEPRCPEHGVVVRVEATGLCRSDWHAWRGHDDGVRLPHVGGHEFAGSIAQVGTSVRGWAVGQRVTAPFVNACGSCPSCDAGEQQVCLRQTQPGFSRWGSFAELVSVDHAEVNLVALPEGLSAVAAAALGCRFATAWRAVVRLGQVQPGQSVAVHGCGGVGLSAVMVARSREAQVTAFDPSPAALDLAVGLGAIRALPTEGAHLSLDCIGHPDALAASIACLRPRGRHVQVGLLLGHREPRVDLGRVVAAELQLLGSHGMAAHDYPAMLADITSGLLQPGLLVHRTISLEELGPALVQLDSSTQPGATVAVL
jgi:alcohol dehydrogenase